MKSVQIAAATAAFAAAALAGVLFRPLMPIDETRYLAVAWDMHLTGSHLVPHLNGETYSHKPPLLFWLIDLVWRIFGVSETAARLVGPAFGAATVALTGVLAGRLWPQDPKVGGRAAWAVAGLGVFALYGGLTMFDAILACATTLGALAIATEGARTRGWVVLGAAFALGALGKGPVILVNLLPLAALAPLWAGVTWRRTATGLGIALGVGLALVALWLVPAVIVGGPDYRTAVLWSQHAGRVADSFAHDRPFWFFAALLPLLLWPWAWAPQAWRGLARIGAADRGLRLAAIWAGASFVIFSLISGKQTHYMLPALPAVALVVARAMGAAPAALRAPLAGLLPTALGVAVAALALGAGDDRLDGLFQPAWAMLLVAALLIALGASALRLRGAGLAALGLLLPPLASLAFLFGAPHAAYDAGPIGRELALHEDAGIAIVARDYQGEFTFAGRLTRPVETLEDAAAAQAWLAAHPGGALVARLDRDVQPAGEPQARYTFRNRPYGLWTADAAATPTPEPAS